jgi:hypothetical protein
LFLICVLIKKKKRAKKNGFVSAAATDIQASINSLKQTPINSSETSHGQHAQATSAGNNYSEVGKFKKKKKNQFLFICFVILCLRFTLFYCLFFFF